jgi:hypothetical protein
LVSDVVVSRAALARRFRALRLVSGTITIAQTADERIAATAVAKGEGRMERLTGMVGNEFKPG